MWDIWGDKYTIICLSFWSYFEFMWGHIFSWACRRIGDHHYHTELIICGDHLHHTDNDDGWGRSLIRFSSSSHASSSTLWPSRLLHNLWGVNSNFWPFSHFECKFWMKWGQKNCHLQQTSLVKILSTRKTMRAQARISLRDKQSKRWGWEDCCKKIKRLIINMQYNEIVLHGVVCS